MPNPLVINAGELRHQVLIQAPPAASAGQDTFGGPIPGDWTTVRTAWAKITTASAPKPKEDVQGGQFSAQVTHIITVRYTATPAIAGGMRVVFGSHTYLIQTVDNTDLRNIRIDLMCLEIDGSSE